MICQKVRVKEELLLRTWLTSRLIYVCQRLVQLCFQYPQVWRSHQFMSNLFHWLNTLVNFCVQMEFLLQLIATSTVLLLYASKHGTLFSVTPYEVDSQEILPQPYLQGLNKSPPLSPSSCSTFTTLVIFCWSLPNFLLSSFTKRTRLDVANSPNAVSCIHSSNQRGSKNRPLQGKQLLWIKNLTRLSSLKTPLLQLMCSYTTPYSWLPSEHTNEKKTEPLFSVGTIWNTGNSI